MPLEVKLNRKTLNDHMVNRHMGTDRRSINLPVNRSAFQSKSIWTHFEYDSCVRSGATSIDSAGSNRSMSQASIKRDQSMGQVPSILLVLTHFKVANEAQCSASCQLRVASCLPVSCQLKVASGRSIDRRGVCLAGVKTSSVKRRDSVPGRVN